MGCVGLVRGIVWDPAGLELTWDGAGAVGSALCPHQVDAAHPPASPSSPAPQDGAVVEPVEMPFPSSNLCIQLMIPYQKATGGQL